MIFELAWSWYEDYQPHLFSHENKTREEFEQDAKFLLKKYGPEYLDQETSWAQAPGWITYVVKKFPELGYKIIEPERVSVFGSYIIEGDEEDLEFGKNFVGTDLLNQAIDHNINLRAAKQE
jgi:hypothetical protein